jgi:hypothetical protein
MDTGTVINWDLVIESIEFPGGEVTAGLTVHDMEGQEASHQDEIVKEILKSNYDLNSIEWYNYFRKHLTDTNFIDKFSEIVNCAELDSWVSIVRPGKTVPKHWDICLADQLAGHKDAVRYVCFMSKPEFGQFLVVKDKSIYNPPQGSIVKWDNHLDIHGAANVGNNVFYLFNYIGKPI